MILLRHGQSVWNEKNLFTGWVDIPLNKKGVEEALQAGKAIASLPIDLIFTSTLVRSHMTLLLALLDLKKIPVFQHPRTPQFADWDKIYSEKTIEETVPVFCAWELNERMYGELQGLNKEETAQKFGKDKVHQWRRSFDIAPPSGESLQMTAERTWPFFQKSIMPHIQQGKTVFICAHGNSLRSIVMHLENLTPEAITHLEIPTGEPFLYSFHQGTWQKIV